MKSEYKQSIGTSTPQLIGETQRHRVFEDEGFAGTTFGGSYINWPTTIKKRTDPIILAQ